MHSANKSTEDRIERVAEAIHNASEPYTDWADLPEEDSSFGIGKLRRREQARAAVNMSAEPLLTK